MLTILALLTLRKMKNKKSYFCGSVVFHTLEHSRTDQIKCFVSQPVTGAVSQLVDVYYAVCSCRCSSEETKYNVGFRGGGTA
jgi:hypothetical protein